MSNKTKSISSKTKSNDDKVKMDGEIWNFPQSVVLVQCKFTCTSETRGTALHCEHRLPHFQKKSCGDDCEIVVSVTM